MGFLCALSTEKKNIIAFKKKVCWRQDTTMNTVKHVTQYGKKSLVQI